MASEFHKLRITNLDTGESELLYDDQIQVEIDGEGLVSILTPNLGSREFLLKDEALESAKQEVGL